jgi:2-polyprenyl-6-methoxyphenol hydroxylase-like FAD-dependent oxidoreductase
MVIQHSALHTLNKWPGYLDRLKAISYKSDYHFKKYDGSKLGIFPLGDPEHPSAGVNRGTFHNLLWDYARESGIEVEFSSNVVEYFETDGHGGVILSDGRRLTTDVVVAADGVGSYSSKLILQSKNLPISSGFAIYRTTFPAYPALKNPIIAKEFEGFED